MPGVDITVVVVTHRGRTLLPACLDSVDAQTRPHELLVVDNASADGTAAYLADRLPSNQVLRCEANTGFAGGVAAAFPRLRTRFVALLNDDAQAAPDWLETLWRQATSDDSRNRATAAWTSVLVDADRPELVQNAGVGLLRSGYGVDLLPGEPAGTVGDGEVFGFSGGAALLRTDAVRAVGGFPAEFFLYYEDTDTSWRLRRAGWQVRRVAAARVRHEHSATADQRSEQFHFCNERNRLWTLTRNAPAGVLVAAVTGFGVTTVSLAARRLVRQPVPESANLRVQLRLRVLSGWFTALPRLLRHRQQIAGRSWLGRREIWRSWSGRAG